MIKPHILSLVFLGALFFTSCEKVIEVDLDDAEPQIVIEAELDANAETLQVSISKTGPYFEAGEGEMVENAMVTLNVPNGNAIQVPYEGEGQYRTSVAALPDNFYQLEVVIDDQQFTAQSYLPEAITLDTLYAEYMPGGGLIEEGYFVYFSFKDPAGEANYYRLKHQVNGIPQTTGGDLQVTDDQLFDGGTARFPIFQKTFQAEEEILVELIHFDEASFEYFNSLADIIGSGGGPNGGSAAPGNPNTNWAGGALGYFSAFYSDELSLFIE